MTILQANWKDRFFNHGKKRYLHMKPKGEKNWKERACRACLFDDDSRDTTSRHSGRLAVVLKWRGFRMTE
jgi:hypothetical protein